MQFTPKTEQEIEMSKLMPEGIYNFEVSKAEPQRSKNGNEMIKLTLKIFDKKTQQEYTIFDYLLEAMMFKLKHFCDATGLQSEYNLGRFSPEDCHGKRGLLHIIVDPESPKEGGGFYAPKNSVKDYIKKENDTSSYEKELAKNLGLSNEFKDDDVPFFS